jgi:hypothetical protein
LHLHRFSTEWKSNIHPIAHIEFGNEPRGCIGRRFATEFTKVAMIKMISEFRFVADKRTQVCTFVGLEILIKVLVNNFTLMMAVLQDPPAIANGFFLFSAINASELWMTVERC